MNPPIKFRTTFALLLAVGLGAVGLAQGVSADLHVPAARALVAECQGFEALATVGSRPLTCSAEVAASAAPDSAGTPVVDPGATPVFVRKKA